MKTINLFGAPSSGKSATMLGLTYQLKMNGLSAENTPEFFKELILEGSDKTDFGGQLYILSEQNRRLARLEGKNDFAVTDCPLPLIGFYTKENYINGFKKFVNNLFENYDNVNYFLVRKHEFENEKRNHDAEQADEINIKLMKYLQKKNIPFKIIETDQDVISVILHDLVHKNIITLEQLENSRQAKVRKNKQLFKF
jgi:hypothetical protein